MTDDAPQSPAKITALHKQDRPIFDDEANLILGKKGFRRIDRLRWLLDHKVIAEHQYKAGDRLQSDWQLSKIENCPSMIAGGGGGGVPRSTLPDAKLDAMERVGKAMDVVPKEVRPLLGLFLFPEDEPFSLERCANMVRMDRAAASLAIRVGLSLLARHYGFSSD